MESGTSAVDADNTAPMANANKHFLSMMSLRLELHGRACHNP